jgi:dTDP-4-amino-4,6-dideoxygalactose transaminase
VRLYDLDPATLSPDLESLRRTVERGVDAIVVAHLYGYPADAAAVGAIAAEYGVPVIDDAAQGAGSTLNGVRTGGLGDVGVLSFGRGKGTTGGSGGAALVQNARLGSRVALAASLGAPPRGVGTLVPLAAQWMLARPTLYRMPASIPALKLGEMVYHPAHEPRALSRAAAAVVHGALLRDPDEVHARRERAEQLRVLAVEARRFRPVRSVSGGQPGYLRFAVLGVASDVEPAPHLGALRGYPLTLDQHAPLRDLLLPGETAGAGARTLRDHLFTLPTHSHVTSRDLDRSGRWLGAQRRPHHATISASEIA